MAEMLGVIKNGTRFLIGGGGSSAEDIGIRYDEENDMVQLYYNGQWLDWKLGGMDYPIGSVIEFECTGTIQSLQIPGTGYWQLEVWGASGGNSIDQRNASTTYHPAGGNGGYAKGTVYLSSADTIYIGVGGAGKTYGGGASDLYSYNGGGTTTSDSGGGGGATHIGYANALLKDTPAVDVLIVASGGGGAGCTKSYDWTGAAGGAGGGLSGSNGSSTGGNGTRTGGGGGTQSAGGSGGVSGSFGQGGSSPYGAGGGGGYYGGGSGNGGTDGYNSSGAGGGSSYFASGLTNTQTTAGQNSGNGKAKLTYLGISA